MSKIIQILFFVAIILSSYQHSYAIDWNKTCECLDNEEKFLSYSEQDGVGLLTLVYKQSADVRIDFSTKSNVSLDSARFQKYNSDKTFFELWNSKELKWEATELAKVREADNSSGDLELTTSKEGLYKISNNESGENTFYIIVVDDILKSLRKYLAGMKKEVEVNPDPELYKSSIFISKINHLLGKKEDGLTYEFAQKLCHAAREYRGLKEGKCPKLTPGSYRLMLKRFPGASIARYSLFIPDSYSPDVKPPFVFDAGACSFTQNITLALDPSQNQHNWEDFQFVFNIFSKKLNLDMKRIYISGNCRYAINAMGIALEHPDFWAGCFLELGNSKLMLSGNAYNMHVLYSRQTHHFLNPASEGWYIFTTKCLEYNRCPDVDYHYEGEKRINDTLIKGVVQNDSPEYIQYRTDSLKRGKAYWISIDSRTDEGLYADIKAKVVGSIIYVETENVESYSICLERAPLKSNLVSIIETDRLQESLTNKNPDINVIRKYDCNLTSRTVESSNSENMAFNISQQSVFKRYPKRYDESNYLKYSQLSGGINDVFTQKFAVVCPYLKDESSVYTQFAHKLASGVPCYTDFDSARKYFDTHNIIFIGSSADFSALEDKVKDVLPSKITIKTVTVAESIYSGDLGVFSISPNPLNPNKYLAFFVCNSNKIASRMSSAYNELNKMSEIDHGIFRITKRGQLEWIVAEKLDATWNYHGDYGDVLVDVKKTHDWRWKAWRAEAIRKQIEADVGIFENCFSRPEKIPEGVLTRRDIHRYFQNTWLVKVEMKGIDLKKILTTSFKKKREVVPEISGVSYTKNKKAGQIYINEIRDDKSYTLVCPKKCLNGTRIGVCPKEYKIIDDGFAVDIILDYLSEMQIDLNEELAKQKIKII